MNLTTSERFWRHVQQTESCWNWTGAKTFGGYAQFRVSGKGPTADQRAVHRLAYEWLVGAIPAGLQIDHLCGNRACVNPDHLEAVSPRQNTLRGRTLAAANSAKAACPRGHTYDALTISNGTCRRRCKECARASTARYRAMKRAERT